MRRIAGSNLLPLFVVFSCIGFGRIHSASSEGVPALPTGDAVRIEDFGGLPLRFELNRGQADSQARFLCRATGYNLLLTSTGAAMSLPKSLLTIHFDASEPNPHIEGIDPLPGTTNYFLGNDPKHWRTNIQNYGTVRYGGIYPGIDLVYRGNGRNLEYDFIVSLGADTGRIRVSFEGAGKIEVKETGDLVVETPSGPVIQRRPNVWQENYPLPFLRVMGFSGLFEAWRMVQASAISWFMKVRAAALIIGRTAWVVPC